MTGVSRGMVVLALFVSLFSSTFLSPAARAEPWRSSLHDMTHVVIEKRVRNEAGLADRAFIANNSWNENTTGSGGAIFPLPIYDVTAQFYDNRVLDANTALAGNQPMTLVFSAGNYAYNCSTQAISWDSVSSLTGCVKYYPTPTPQQPFALYAYNLN